MMRILFFFLILLCTVSSCSGTNSSESVSDFKEAASLYIKGKTDEALFILEQKNCKRDELIPFLYLSGKIYLIKNNPDAAEKKWIKVLKINPFHIQTGKHLISLYISQKKYKKAEKLLFKFLEISADDPGLLMLAGKLKKCEEKYSEAIEYYSKAFLFEDRIIEAYLETAEIYILFGVKDKAVSILEKASLTGGKNHELYKPVRSLISSLQND